MEALKNNNDSLFSLPKSIDSSESSSTSPSFPLWIILFILILVLAYFYLNYGFEWINDSISFATGVKRTYGYMDEPGTYQFKIRYNALTHNYLNFLIGD